MNYTETYFELDSEEATHCDHCHLICCVYIKGHVEMVDTKDQSNAIMYCVCYVVCWQCWHIQRKILKRLGVPHYLVACSIQHVSMVSTYPGSCKTCFSRTPVFGGKVFLIFPIIYQTVDMKLIYIIGQSDLINILILPISTLDDILLTLGTSFPFS